MEPFFKETISIFGRFLTVMIASFFNKIAKIIFGGCFIESSEAFGGVWNVFWNVKLEVLDLLRSFGTIFKEKIPIFRRFLAAMIGSFLNKIAKILFGGFWNVFWNAKLKFWTFFRFWNHF